MNPNEATDRTRFMENVRRALGFPPGRREVPEGLFRDRPDREVLRAIHDAKTRSRDSRLELLELLRERAGPLKISVTAVEDAGAAALAVARLVRETCPEWGVEKRVAVWRHPLPARLDLPRILGDSDVPVFTAGPCAPGLEGMPAEESREHIRKSVVESCIGVTAADYCVADTATLVMKTRPGQPRMLSLVPSAHIAVITLDQILADLRELYAFLRWEARERKDEGLTNCLTMVTGPSKTADIELSMVHGAHGPRELHIAVIIGPAASTAN